MPTGVVDEDVSRTAVLSAAVVATEKVLGNIVKLWPTEVHIFRRGTTSCCTGESSKQETMVHARSPPFLPICHH